MITQDDIYAAGRAVLAAMGTAVQMGHRCPNGMMDYVPRPDGDLMAAAVWDAFAATRTEDFAKAAQVRMIEFVHKHGIDEAVAEAVVR